MRLDAIDINTLFLGDMTMYEIAAIRDQLSLPVLMISTYSDFTNPDAYFRKQEIENAIRNIKYAKQIGTKYVRLTAGQAYPDCSVSRTIDNVYTCFEACVPIAEQCGVRILIENHSKPDARTYPDFNFHPLMLSGFGIN
jgi:sugar phosphate isomerase/epimerase